MKTRRLLFSFFPLAAVLATASFACTFFFSWRLLVPSPPPHTHESQQRSRKTCVTVSQGKRTRSYPFSVHVLIIQLLLLLFHCEVNSSSFSFFIFLDSSVLFFFLLFGCSFAFPSISAFLKAAWSMLQMSAIRYPSSQFHVLFERKTSCIKKKKQQQPKTRNIDELGIRLRRTIVCSPCLAQLPEALGLYHWWLRFWHLQSSFFFFRRCFRGLRRVKQSTF